MNPRTLFATMLLVLANAGAAHADNRIQQVRYDPEAVTRIDACLGFQTMIEFGSNERIENVGVGDATQWLVVPNARANLLFVRPSLATTHSNMTVATDQRRYVFELSAAQTDACAQGDVVYYLRFQYDETPAASVPASAPASSPTAPVQDQRNTDYTFTGAPQNVPFRVFDNGRSTFFQWAEGGATPAVYIRSADGAETPTTFVSHGEYLVTDQVAQRFVLRNGEAETVLFNEAYRAPQLDSSSPQPRARARRGFWPFGRREANHADE